MSYYISFLGAPGSGKGTQTELLKKEYNIEAFATGDIIREEVEKGSELGKLAKDFIVKGDLLPDEVIIKLFKSYVSGDLIENGFISDGYPRTIEQAKAFSKLLEKGKWDTKIFYLEVSLSRLKERLSARKRLDDTPESIVRRFEIYNEIVSTLKAYFKDKLVYIDGEAPPEKVFENIKSHLT